MLRRSRLRATKSLVRKTPLRSSKEKRAGRRDTGPDRTTRELVLERDDWRCSRCGESIVGRPRSIHHRRNRGAGGSSDPAINRPSNLLTTCGTGTTGCHGWITEHPDDAEDLGFVVSLNSTTSPADIPVLHALYGLIFLTDDGEFDFPPHFSHGGR